MNEIKRKLVFSWGNPSRGDDALGPLFAQAIEAMNLPDVECLTDFQLQIEHALDLQGRERVLFVDASCQAQPDDAAPFQFGPLAARRDDSYTTHAMSPAALLQVYADMEGQAPPPAWLLAIPGDSWELGDAPSARAQERLTHAVRWAATWLTAATDLPTPIDLTRLPETEPT
jgi:hydrogenase maturation protease